MSHEHIYHITSFYDWELQSAYGEYIHPSLAEEGFIHMSTEDQVPKVLERYYDGVSGLVVLKVKTSQLKNELKYEKAPSDGDNYPHLFGSLNVDAVVEVEML